MIFAAACGGGGGGNTGGGGSGGTASASSTTGTGGAATSSSTGEGAGFNFDAGPPPDADMPCAVSTQEASLIPANILFVIDRSGSMTCNPPPLQSSVQCENNPTTKYPNQSTKWQIVSSALKSAIAAMPPTTRVGISYFNIDDYCGVKQAPQVSLAPVDATQLAAINASIDGVTPKGATPIIGGLTLGYAHMFYDDPAPGNDFVVLLTDGAETCAPNLKDQMINQTVPDALSVNIRTFVIGAPGSEPARAFLSQIAYAGGTPRDPACKHNPAPDDVGDCHFDMTDPNLDFATALNDALSKISGKAIACELDVPTAVGDQVDYDKVNVTFTPGTGPDVDFFQDNQPCNGGANGWQYNADKSKIELCGDACKMVKSDPKGKISIALGCETKIAQ
ncbi:MAG: VWA domain-containing protein [Minicystis sp.]